MSKFYQSLPSRALLFFLVLAKVFLPGANTFAVWPPYEEEQENVGNLASQIVEKNSTILKCLHQLRNLEDARREHAKDLSRVVPVLKETKEIFLQNQLFSRDECELSCFFNEGYPATLKILLGKTSSLLKGIVDSLVIYDTHWKEYQGAHEAHAPQGSYATCLYALELWCQESTKRGFQKARMLKSKKGGYPVEEESILPTSIEALRLGSIECHSKTRDAIKSFKDNVLETIKTKPAEKQISSTSKFLLAWIKFLKFPKQFDHLREENPFKKAYNSSYQVLDAFSKRATDWPEEANPDIQKRRELVIAIMKVYDNFWRIGLQEQARGWEADNLLPLLPAELSDMFAQILEEEGGEAE